ncbi:MAG: bifunctional DNA-formamidopyrimidine glycosylase/DNA-(apurinic or apyrimidinic site) lyase [Actinomycetes bacterium]
MPELPEVETVRAGLAPSITNATIKSVEVFEPRSLRRHPGTVANFVAELEGRRVLGCVRRGKFLWMPLGDSTGSNAQAQPTGLALVGHLGMSGQVLLRTPDYEPDKLTRVVIHFESAGARYEFRFVDQRIFGGLAIDQMIATQDSASGGFHPEVSKASWMNTIPQSVAHIARDPLDPDFDLSAVIVKMRTKSTGIKHALLDQGLVSGIGNIYADEALWRSKLFYDRQCSEISVAKLKELFANVHVILEAAVKQGGTSFDEQYKNVNGESGYFSQTLNAYGQTGLPCARCGTSIRREAWANRGSHFCPRCQRR